MLHSHRATHARHDTGGMPRLGLPGPEQRFRSEPSLAVRLDSVSPSEDGDLSSWPDGPDLIDATVVFHMDPEPRRQIRGRSTFMFMYVHVHLWSQLVNKHKQFPKPSSERDTKLP